MRALRPGDSGAAARHARHRRRTRRCEDTTVSDAAQHPVPPVDDGHVTESPIQQDREPHHDGQAGPGAAAVHVDEQACRVEAGDGATAAVEAQAWPTRRPRFRDRPRHWWLLASIGWYGPALAAPPRLVTR